MKIIGRNISLREITDEDLLQLHKWRNSVDFIKFCASRRSKINFFDFGFEIYKDLTSDRFIQFIIVAKNGSLVGTLYAYRYCKNDATIFVTTFLDSQFRHHGYGVDALMLCGKYFFEEINIIKLYTEVYSYNERVIKILKRAGFIEEDCLKNHRLVNGVMYDMHILAFSSEYFLRESTQKLLRRLT